MAPPVNIDALNAIELGPLPASLTQNVNDGLTTYTVWYKYTITADDVEVGVWGYGDLTGSLYVPTLHVFGPNSSITPYLSIVNNNNRPVQFPATSVGDVFYLQFVKNFNNPASILTLEASSRKSSDTASIGSILVNDDTVGFPIAILSATVDNVVDKFVQSFAAGESADILSDGTILAYDNDLGLQIYDGNLALVTTIVLDLVYKHVSSNGTSKFYVGAANDGGVTKVKTISSAGVIGGTTWTIATAGLALYGIAVSPDETILYYTGTNFSGAIKRWDLVNDIALSDLASAVATYTISDREILCLSDGTIIAGYHRSPTEPRNTLRRYNPNGTLASTYNFTSVTTTIRLAHAIDEPNSFWVWLEDGVLDGVSNFYNVKVSDGSILTNRTQAQFEVGVSLQDPTLGMTLFGSSESCTFLILRTSLGPAPACELAIVKTTADTFTQGNDASFTLTVSNTGGADTSGVVTVTEALPDGLTLVSMSGTGWVCVGNVCTRSDVLAAGASYPVIIVAVTVNLDATTPQLNSVDLTSGCNNTSTTLSVPIVSISPTGIYVFVIDRTHDTVYLDSLGNTADIKIP